MAQQHSAHKSLEKLRAENETLALKEKERKVILTVFQICGELCILHRYKPWKLNYDKPSMVKNMIECTLTILSLKQLYLRHKEKKKKGDHKAIVYIYTILLFFTLEHARGWSQSYTRSTVLCHNHWGLLTDHMTGHRLFLLHTGITLYQISILCDTLCKYTWVELHNQLWHSLSNQTPYILGLLYIESARVVLVNDSNSLVRNPRCLTTSISVYWLQFRLQQHVCSYRN